MTKILDVQNLSLYSGNVTLLIDISFTLEQGQIMTVFGPSGSGKSLLCKSILNLQNQNLHKTGKILFMNKDISHQNNLKSVRGKTISIMFQSVSKSLNPMLTLGQHLVQVSKRNNDDLLMDVGFSNPIEILQKYPHQVSGGELSRFGLALALAPNPRLLILDEAFTSIDDNLKTKFVNLIKNLVHQKQLSIILVTHDLDILDKLSDNYIVMQNGEIIETNNNLSTSSNSEYLKNSISSFKRLYNDDF